MKAIISEYFSVIPFVVAVYLHGSFSKGTMRKDSDIDVAIIVSGKKPDRIKLLEFSSDLELKLNRVIDIGIISSENLVYSKEVIINGICIYSRDSNLRQLNEATLLSMYVDFQFERREVLNAYSN